MSDTIDRNIPFTPEVFEAVKESSKRAKRTFKWQAAALIEKGLLAESAEDGDGK